MKRTGRSLVILTVAAWLAALTPALAAPSPVGDDPVRIGIGVGGDIIDVLSDDDGDDDGDDGTATVTVTRTKATATATACSAFSSATATTVTTTTMTTKACSKRWWTWSTGSWPWSSAVTTTIP